LLSCAALTALALHWVVWRWTGSAAAGFVAAWTLLMNRWYLWGFVASTPHLAVIQYFPLIVFLAAAPLRTRRQTLVLLGLVVVQCLTDPVYVAPAVLAPLAVLASARLIRRAWRPSGWRLLGVLVAVPLCLAPFLIGYVRVRLANPVLAAQTLWGLASIHAIKGVMPAELTTMFWFTPTPRTPAPILVGFAVIGLIVAGGLTGALRRWWGAGSGLGHPWAHAALWVLVGTFVSLTPVTAVDFPRLDGTWTRTRIHLPQYLLAVHTPLYEVARVPARLGVSAMIGICLLAGLATAELARALAAAGVRGLSGRLARVGLAVTIATLVYRVPPRPFAALPHAYPAADAPRTDPALLRQLRATDGPLLEVPALDSPVRTPRMAFATTRPNATAMYRSTLHWRPLLNGYSSYWPVGFIKRLRPTIDVPTPLALQRLVCDTGVRTILVNLASLRPVRRAAWLRAKESPPPGLRFVGEYPNQLLFAVTVPLPGTPGGPICVAAAS
jgi:hypothetical protein